MTFQTINYNSNNNLINFMQYNKNKFKSSKISKMHREMIFHCMKIEKNIIFCNYFKKIVYVIKYSIKKYDIFSIKIKNYK